MFAHIGRQAIYNQSYAIDGYELFYRNGSRGNTALFLDGDAATRSLLSDAVNVFTIPELTGGLPAYVNFTRNLLMEGLAYASKPGEIVVEVPGDIYADADVEDRLEELKTAGYRIALDGYTPKNTSYRYNRLLRYYDVIRLNIGETSRQEVRTLMERFPIRNAPRLLAARIETEEQFDLALSMKFNLFQGYFFEKPQCLSKKVLLSETAYGRMLNELLRSDYRMNVCGGIIASDVILKHAFLRQVADSDESFGQVEEDIRRGLIAVGSEGLRRWFCLLLLRQGNATGKVDLPRRAYLRGRFIESLVEHASTRLLPERGFFLGMFSLLDRVIDVPMPELVRELELEPAMTAALLGKTENEYARFLQYAVIYELANEKLILPNIGLRISPRETSALFLSCKAEADEAFYTGG